MVNPSLIHSNKLTYKISFIFVKTLLGLFRDFHVSAFLIYCEQTRHPSCAKIFVSNSCKIYPTRSFEMHIVSAISRTFIHRSSNTTSCTCLMVSGVVALFGRPSRGSSSRLLRPCLNSSAHFLIVENEGEESP